MVVEAVEPLVFQVAGASIAGGPRGGGRGDSGPLVVAGRPTESEAARERHRLGQGQKSGGRYAAVGARKKRWRKRNVRLRAWLALLAVEDSGGDAE